MHCLLMQRQQRASCSFLRKQDHRDTSRPTPAQAHNRSAFESTVEDKFKSRKE